MAANNSDVGISIGRYLQEGKSANRYACQVLNRFASRRRNREIKMHLLSHGTTI
jgi:hypothetical protein